MHAILRGIDRTAIFFAEPDWRAFLNALTDLAVKESVSIHAYVLMTNHVHLLMTPATDQGRAGAVAGGLVTQVLSCNSSQLQAGLGLLEDTHATDLS